MASLEVFVLRVNPALDAFLSTPTLDNLQRLEHELKEFNLVEMKIFHVKVLMPLVFKLEELSENTQDIRAGTMNCIRIVISNLYLKNEKVLTIMLSILLKQIRDCTNGIMWPNLSEEIKLAALHCIAETLRRATSDVLELYYTNKSAIFLGQLLLTIVHILANEQYRKLLIAAIQCLMVVYYVHDEADARDVVLRNQVANTLFIFVPKIIMVLFNFTLADEKLGDTIKTMAITALGRIICVMFEETEEATVRSCYDISEFKKLIDNTGPYSTVINDKSEIFTKTRNNGEVDNRLQRIQDEGRSEQWFLFTSKKLRSIFMPMTVLRSHHAAEIRKEYAQMCCLIMGNCALHLEDNFVYMLESIVAMSQDEDESVRRICRKSLQQLQSASGIENVFDATCEVLFDEHIIKLPRIINRCDEAEQYAELMFLKGFLRQLHANKLQLLLAVPKNLELFGMCLLAAVDLQVNRDLLNDEHSLRQLEAIDYTECAKLHWRKYKNLSSKRCIQAVQELCNILGSTPAVNRLLFEHYLEMLQQQQQSMNEIILIMLWLATSDTSSGANRLELVQLLLEELLDDKHWHLALQPDQAWRLKIEKPIDWFVDHTPGLYESAIEIRTQDYDSDDDEQLDIADNRNRITIADAQFNVLHTCLTLDALAHSAIYIGEQFDKYMFRSLHKVLLKIATSNSIIHQAATFALLSMKKALHLAETSLLIETHTDYLTYHLNTILKRSSESQCAVDILTVVLQLGGRKALSHLESIFQTIREECSKAYQSDHINSYLKVFNAFLTHVRRGQVAADSESADILMQIDDELHGTADLLAVWLGILEKSTFDDVVSDTEDLEETEETIDGRDPVNMSKTEAEDVPSLPRHVEISSQLLKQILKFVACADKLHQILALECLISGVPILKDYENELLPLVHTIWQPLMEKFRQKDALVLNRCFTLLTTLATTAKDFILKRSLDDVMPYLTQFLQAAAEHSAQESLKVQTQEYKLQLKLLQDFANLIESMQIEGRHLNEIIEVIAIYLSAAQPQEFQALAVQFFSTIRFYNGPLVYLVVLKRMHCKEYKDNVSKVMLQFGLQ